MSEIIKGLGKFLARDLMYVIGGGTFLLSAILAFGCPFTQILELIENPIVSMVAVAFAYVIGYLNQEMLSLTHVVTTSRPRSNRFLCWLYQRFTGSEYKEPPQFDYTSERIRMLERYKEDQLAELERIISLKHIGSSVGSSWLMAALVLFVMYFVDRSEFIALVVACYLLLCSVGLILTTWIKGMQQYTIMYSIIKIIRDNTKDVAKPVSRDEPPNQ